MKNIIHNWRTKWMPLFMLSAVITGMSLAYRAEAAPKPAGEILATLFDKNPAKTGKEIDLQLKDMARKQEFSGVILVAKGDKILFEKAYGLASREYNVPNTPETRFNLASVNKMFTAVAIVQLQEAGSLRFDDPIGKYIGADWVADEQIRQKVTIGHMLSHTSGLGSYFTPEFFDASRTQYRILADYKPLVVNAKLSFEPGTKWDYSNLGFLLLGVVIEKASGMKYDNYLQEKIFLPAGMKSTASLDLDRVNTLYAQGYYQGDPDKEPSNAPPTAEDLEWHNNIFLHVIRGGPAGGMYSNAHDLLAFANAFTSGKLVSLDSVRLMTTPKPSSPTYGYGMTLRPDSMGHTGGFPGISIQFSMAQNGYRIIILSNIGEGATNAIKLFKKQAGEIN